VSISVVKCSWMKCGEVQRSFASVVMFSSFFLLYRYLYILCSFVSLCMFSILLYPSVRYVNLLSCLCIIVIMLCYVYSVFLPATMTKVFPCFSSAVRQMPGYNS
jgi:hypothetical protein